MEAARSASMVMSSLSMSLSKASKDTMPSFLHATRQRVSEITATKREESAEITNLLHKLRITRWIFFQQFWDDGLFQIRPQRSRIFIFSGRSGDIFPSSSGLNSLGNCPKYRITTPTCLMDKANENMFLQT